MAFQNSKVNFYAKALNNWLSIFQLCSIAVYNYQFINLSDSFFHYIPKMETILLVGKILMKSGSTRWNLNLNVFYIFIQVLSSQRQGQKQSLYVWICLKKEDHVILTANCTCVAGCIFVFLSFTLLHFILKKNKHLTY